MIQDLLNEIEYYESRGFYKLADKLTLSLFKYSAELDDFMHDAKSAPGLEAITSASIRQEMMKIFANCPSCQAPPPGAGIESTPDFKNWAVSLGLNADNFQDVLKQIKGDISSSSESNLRELYKQGNPCIKCLFQQLRPQSFLQSLDSSGPNTQTNANVPPTI